MNATHQEAKEARRKGMAQAREQSRAAADAASRRERGERRRRHADLIRPCLFHRPPATILRRVPFVF